MKRDYVITFDVAEAGGMMASSYLNSSGQGLLSIEGTDEQFDNPADQVFSVSGVIDKAWDMDGVRMSAKDIGKMHFGPILYMFKTGPASFAGSNWSATLTLTLSDDQNTLQAIVTGTGTGLARFAAKNIRIIINGTVKQA
jgi:hypothetical protein